VSSVGLRPPFVTPAAAHSHPDCRGILILIVAPQRTLRFLFAAPRGYSLSARAMIHSESQE
jgi:hypothetical protein